MINIKHKILLAISFLFSLLTLLVLVLEIQFNLYIIDLIFSENEFTRFFLDFIYFPFLEILNPYISIIALIISIYLTIIVYKNKFNHPKFFKLVIISLLLSILTVSFYYYSLEKYTLPVPEPLPTCNLECDKYYFGNCPEGCIQQCVGSCPDCADCGGSGSCRCP